MHNVPDNLLGVGIHASISSQSERVSAATFAVALYGCVSKADKKGLFSPDLQPESSLVTLSMEQ